MAYFASPCQKNVLNKKDAGTTMPKLIQSTFQRDFVSPKITIKNELKEEVETALPPDCLPEDSGKRILPTSFKDFYKNCITAYIGDKLELKFTDDTPNWKMTGREAAAKNWIKGSKKNEQNKIKKGNSRKSKSNSQSQSMEGGSSGNGGSGTAYSYNYPGKSGGSGSPEHCTCQEFNVLGCNYPCFYHHQTTRVDQYNP